MSNRKREKNPQKKIKGNKNERCKTRNESSDTGITG